VDNRVNAMSAERVRHRAAYLGVEIGGQPSSAHSTCRSRSVGLDNSSARVNTWDSDQYIGPCRHEPPDWVGDMPAHPHSAEFAERAELFCAKVRQAYDEHGLTQLQLVERTGLSQGYLKLLLNNRGSHRDPDGNYKPANPTLDVITKLAAALELDIGYLVDPERPVERSDR